MQYRTLGRTGIQVSPYALGALMFATSMGNGPEESARIIHKALDMASTSSTPPTHTATRRRSSARP